MPLVRISHVAGKPPGFGSDLSHGVHSAMMETFNVPPDDYFQIVTEHAANQGLVGPKSFLGIDHSPELVMVQITCAEGRMTEQKKALYAKVADNLAASGVRREDVIINLVETKRENWSFGNGIAPFA
ncbi:MAG: 4-oxalocrotonate tautomerase [Proteobacteria bacterium SG_bin9]|nr:MAG: 4-oxalocrotonate tautomerase [Proteobacteria bacterium SG_bin9]